MCKEISYRFGSYLPSFSCDFTPNYYRSWTVMECILCSPSPSPPSPSTFPPSSPSSSLFHLSSFLKVVYPSKFSRQEVNMLMHIKPGRAEPWSWSASLECLRLRRTVTLSAQAISWFIFLFLIGSICHCYPIYSCYDKLLDFQRDCDVSHQ